MQRLLLLLFLTIGTTTIAQDTTWVQTFTFDSISTRRADFTFPPELNDKRFEKVLMYYKLKCSALTPWDNYNCGEWDYLTYTRIFDHTGDFDSTQVDSVRYLNNYQSTSTYNYLPFGGNKFDTYVRNEMMRSGASTTTNSILTSSITSTAPFDFTQQGNCFQMLLTASELTNAGITAGDLQSLSLFIPTGGITNNGEILYPSISLKTTSDASITNFHQEGFTEVYNLSRTTIGGNEFVDGENELLFYQPFTWNGTDNVIVEFTFESPGQLQTNEIQFDTESSSPDQALSFGTRNGVMNFDGTNHALTELSDVEIGDDVTIAFWAKGLGNTGVNTSVIEGYDTLNNRILNIHFPWSNNRMYWDCGVGSGYDRIDLPMTGIDNEWHHWTFVKDLAQEEMKIFKDGVLFHSGIDKTRSIGNLHRLVLGGNRSLANHWTGKMDNFELYNVAIDDATIATWYNKYTATPSNPNWSNLLVHYGFDGVNYAVDESANSYLLMPSATGMIDFSERPLVSKGSIDRPIIAFGQGTVSGAATDVEIPYLVTKEPEVVFEFGQVYNHLEITNAFLATPEGAEDVYDITGTIIGSTPFSGTDVLNNEGVTYYEAPYEIIHDVEIGRFITPYGIQFDLGPQGFSWVYDVTDYQKYLKDVVDLAAHNTQELIDLKFAFIEGIPPRDVHDREPIWSEWKSYSYANLDNDNSLPATQVMLSDTSEMFKIKTRFTGHGHNGSVNCCEWDSKDHMISVDGTEVFNWEIWEETACGDNPNVSQGGTWPYAREGWCPGDLVKEYDHDLTPYVTPGTEVTIDYDIEDIPSNDQAQGNGNYIAALDLISYSAPNFQNDAAVVDILNPNDWEYYGKWNPSCQNPRVIIQNTGEQTLTSATIRIYVSVGQPIDFEWTGNLEFLEKEVVEIPVDDINFWTDFNGGHTFTAQIQEINGGWIDEYAQNNALTTNYDSPEVVNGPFFVEFITNNKAFENKWRLEDTDGNIIFERTNLQNQTNYKDTFDLSAGCYSIILEDSDNDGIGFWYSSQVEGETTGQFRLRLVGGGFLEFFPADFGNFHRYNFSVGFTVGIEDENLDHKIVLFPNPTNGLLNVELSGSVGNEAEMQIVDLMGKEVLREKMNALATFASSSVDLTEIPAGHYLVKIVTAEGVYIEEFVKN